MKTRDNNYSSDQFLESASFFNSLIEDMYGYYEDGTVSEERYNSVFKDMVRRYLNIFDTKYSAGNSFKEMQKELIAAIDLAEETYDHTIRYRADGKDYNFLYGGEYYYLLKMLPLCYLLNVDDKHFLKLVKILDDNGIKDFLLDKIICAKLPDRKPITSESYEDYFFLPEEFALERKAIQSDDKKESEKLLKQVLSRLGKRKKLDLEDGEIPENYNTYWTWYIAAITAIMGLDDSSYRDNDFYPKDMHDYWKENVKK